ncbi:membrane protein [Aureimonas altamirensis]|uniref:Membrane protein n=1 Tax=Aureimonas altamirensis TaxID=370622 RepID=A0A0B1Q4H3_9HYPH|nr:DMT family transporter [Aureimonas altamirensis]KHJ53715.1 membrane protein [Aureimonas altamirensis]
MKQRKAIDAQAAATMISLCAIWGTQQVAIKLAAADMAPLLQVGLRSGAAAIVVLLVILGRREHRALGGGTWRPGLIVGALFALEFILFAQGLVFTSASHMSIFLYTAPVFAALGLHLAIPQERLTAIQWLGIAVAFAGIVVTFSGRGSAGGNDRAWLGDLMGIAAGAAWGATTLAVRTTRLASIPASVTLWYQLAGAGLLATAAAVVSRETAVRPSATLFASLGYQTLVISVASYLAWFALLRRYLASRLGVLSLLTPVFGIGFGMIVLHDRLSLPFVLGALVILAGILLVNARDVLARRGRHPHVRSVPLFSRSRS